MQRLAFWFIYPLLLGISKLPFGILYKFSDACFILVYHIVGYRKTVVTNNLKRAFPEKSAREIGLIRKNFYHHMCDLFLEMVKTLSISEVELKNRFQLTNPEELVRLETLNKSIVVMLGHYASYEWIIALYFNNMSYKPYGVYKKIKNSYFNDLIKKIRSRYNTTMITTTETPRVMVKNNFDGVLAQYGIIADQAPKGGKADYWRPFMGIETPVFTGAETLAKRLDLSVVYLHIKKYQRGHYKATFKTISSDTVDIKDYEITDSFFNQLEAQIRERPEFYLWTHKRWKHKRKITSL